ncbi:MULTISPECIES: 2TM domain-containing protein [unclassified Rhizobacter]|uniref:2TM domain-containing protein n=1 Tax=unclassified Rhizobacter TaxID=2640088 RepID=UPI0009E8BC66|nr:MULTISPECIES: 2TM domain-containing protein [unclassified Rhizobacter]
MKRLGRSERKRGLRIHSVVFVLSMALMLGINLWTGAPYWVAYVLAGWGIGVLAHGWFVIGPGARDAGAG